MAFAAPSIAGHTPGVRTPTHGPLALMLVVAAALHALIIFGLGVDLANWSRPTPPLPNMEIVLVHSSAEFAEHGGEKPSIPPSRPVGKRAKEPAKISPVAAAQQPQRAAPRPAVIQETPRQAASPTNKTPAGPAKKPLTAAALLRQRQKIARLSSTANPARPTFAAQPRRKQISAATREYKYASYMEAWRLKVERVGNLNYPEQAKRQRLYGALKLNVALNADGSINDIQLLGSSGHKILDEAAMSIVHLAAPFAPFPESIRAETDVLHIIRRWQFRSSNRLLAAN